MVFFFLLCPFFACTYLTTSFWFMCDFIIQTLTPHMQTSMEELYTPRISGKLLEPSLGDQLQGSFSINLWKSAFHNAFSRICPVRAGGHECGCLPVLARKVCSAIADEQFIIAINNNKHLLATWILVLHCALCKAISLVIFQSINLIFSH